MLKGLDPLLTPPLLSILGEMGHGDELAIVDRNFPSYAHCDRLVSLPGVDDTALLRAILSVFPLDDFQDPSVWIMQTDDGEEGPAAQALRTQVSEAQNPPVGIAPVRRSDFYPRARKVYGMVQTGDARPYACLILAKGVVFET